MTDKCDILMVTSDQRASSLKSAAPVAINDQQSPYEALKLLFEKDFHTVLIDGETPAFSDICTAMRRVKPKLRVFALCTARGEFELRHNGGKSPAGPDNYFIMPPTAREWKKIANIARPKPASEAGQTAESTSAAPATLNYRSHSQPAATLDGRQITRLIDSATEISSLCKCIAELASETLGTEMSWREGRKTPPPGVQQILRLDSEPAMSLWSKEPIDPDNGGSRWISALRMQLPSLSENVRRMSALRRLAITDDLTGAYNRRYFMYFAEKMLAECRKRKRRATVLIYDIDDFKIYNDTYGHAAGDEILRETARLMKQITRKHDVVARIGGDEFAVLFSELAPARQAGSQPIQTPYDLADRFRQAVNSHVFPTLGESAQGKLTISGGLSNFPWDGAVISELLEKADQGLLDSKKAGKNTITLVGSHKN